MHYHLEIVMPPTMDIDAAVAEILEPFNEQGEDEDVHRPSHAFWDWWVIGGRWSGAKIEARIGDSGMKAFHEALTNRNVTVSGLIWGKQELSPASQIEMVDALWNEMFPNSGITSCPLFKHANVSQELDVCELSDIPKDLSASRLIVAAPDYSDPAKLHAEYMIEDEMWNGVTWVKSTWNGNVLSALDAFLERTKNYSEEWRTRCVPCKNWVVVTVDYHS